MLSLPGLEATPQAPVARATDPEGALHELFGFAEFRPGQRAAVDAMLAGRDVLVVMPTGAGKSLCYQLPALMRADLTVVVSPLVSLMQDQVVSLARVAPGRVALVNGMQDSRANQRALDAAARGDLRLLYVAPERFASPRFAAALAGARVGRFVVDEAHCVSQWGHDFRPDYFRLAAAARWLGAESVVASTATATPQVAADIVARLGLRDPARVATGFDRPNLTFAVTACGGPAAAQRGIEAALGEPDALPAIVYAGTRADCERLASRLGRALGVEVGAYHAGLPRDARARVQRRFMGGGLPVVVATNAFGMGVDKPDVRTVCHAAVPVSLEAYYQEAGRAGRDGAPARALLFACAKDKGLHNFFIERAALEESQLRAVATELERAAGRAPADASVAPGGADAPSRDMPGDAAASGGGVASGRPGVPGAVGGRYDVGVAALARAAGDPRDGDAVRAILGHLARAGLIAPSPAAPDRAVGVLAGRYAGPARDHVRAELAVAEKARWRQYRAVWDWVEGGRCRRAGILAHFGDAAVRETRLVRRGAGRSVSREITVPCCDVCDPAARPAPPVARAAGGDGGPRQLATVPLTAAGAERGLDAAVLALVETAEPPLSPRRCVEVLRGSRAAALRHHGYDGLPAYGTYAHLRAAAVLARIDALLAAGALRTTGGHRPTLERA